MEPELKRIDILIQEGISLVKRFEQLGELESVDKAIKLCREAPALIPEGDSCRHMVLSLLAVSFQRRFSYHIANRKDIDQSIAYCIQAIKTAPDSELALLYGELGDSYKARFRQYDQAVDMERALLFTFQAICHTPQDATYLPSLLCKLGMSLFERFERWRDIRDIHHAIVYLKQSLVGKHDSEELPKCWMALGRSLRSRFEYTNKTEDIDESVKYLRLAAKHTPDSQVALKAGCLNQLASALVGRYEHLGELANLDESIQLTQKAIEIVPYGHPDKANCLTNLNQLLRKRFQRLDKFEDLNRAIGCQEESVLLTLDDDPLKPPRLSTLGASLEYRFNRLGDQSDLERGIQLQEKAVRITAPDNPLRSRWLGNLAAALLERYRVQKRHEDIDTSIEYLTQAVSLELDTDVIRARQFSTLGHSYMIRFLHHKRIEDIEHAIIYQNRASALIPESHVNKTSMLIMLATAHWHRFNYAETSMDLILATQGFREAALLSSGKPHQRIQAALQCARISKHVDNAFSLENYTLAMELLPQVVWLGTTIQDRYKNAPGIGSAVSEAAATAIQFGEYKLALEWLEQGRSIVWQQTLKLRTPFDDLRRVDPKCANRLEEIARQLDRKGTPKSTTFDHPEKSSDLENEAQTHRRLAEEWEHTLEQVRNIQGFDSFMRPRKASDLMKAAQNGAVVVINVNELRCDALVLQPNSQDVMHVPLPDFSHTKATIAYKQLAGSLGRKGIRERGFQKKQPQQGNEFKGILSLLWLDVVQPVLKSLGYMVRVCTTIPSDLSTHVPMLAGYTNG